MRTIDPALQARLDGGATTLCSCWLIERRDGLRLGFTDHDEDLAFDGVIFAAAAAVSGSETEGATGLAPGSAEIEGALSAAAITAEDLEAGLYDGATARRWIVDWTRPDLRVLAFSGTLGAIERRGARFVAETLGPAAALNRPVGRAFTARCDARVGDARCGVDMSAPGFAAEAVVSAIAGRRIAVTGLGDRPAGWFALGRVVWLSGAAAGAEAAVAQDRAEGDARTLTLFAAPEGVAVGDRARVEAGCDGGFETCRTKFANAAAFRGFPHAPGESWLTAYPGSGEVHDGGSRHG